MLAENYLSVEPYALALPRGDERLSPRRRPRPQPHLSQRRDRRIFKRTFGGTAKPGQILWKRFIVISGLPD